MITVLCYKKCTTCQKAFKWLDANGVEYKERAIKEENPTYEELKTWYEKSGLPLKLLSTDGMLVKRPLVVGEKTVLTGFSEKTWTEQLLGKNSLG